MCQTAPSPQPFLERLCDGLQQLIQVAIGSQWKPQRRLKNSLNGTWFGYPLHPVFTDVPIAAWMFTVLIDIIWLISPPHNTWAAHTDYHRSCWISLPHGLAFLCGYSRPVSIVLVYGSVHVKRMLQSGIEDLT